MALPHPLFSQILYAAAASTRGVWCRTTNPENLRANLYRTRVLLKDDTLSALVVRLSPRDTSGEIWIINTKPEAALDARPT